MHQTEDNLKDFALWINNPATLCKTKYFQTEDLSIFFLKNRWILFKNTRKQLTLFCNVKIFSIKIWILILKLNYFLKYFQLKNIDELLQVSNKTLTYLTLFRLAICHPRTDPIRTKRDIIIVYKIP